AEPRSSLPAGLKRDPGDRSRRPGGRGARDMEEKRGDTSARHITTSERSTEGPEPGPRSTEGPELDPDLQKDLKPGPRSTEGPDLDPDLQKDLNLDPDLQKDLNMDQRVQDEAEQNERDPDPPQDPLGGQKGDQSPGGSLTQEPHQGEYEGHTAVNQDQDRDQDLTANEEAALQCGGGLLALQITQEVRSA
ncbi:Protein P200, partial [Dissostichus eleginoides]